jgi:large subunit ribosomal protein L4
VVNPNDTNTIRSFLNLPEVQLIEVNELNAYDVLCSDWVVFSKSTLPGEVTEAAPAKKAPAKKAAAKKAEAVEAVEAVEADAAAESSEESDGE